MTTQLRLATLFALVPSLAITLSGSLSGQAPSPSPSAGSQEPQPGPPGIGPDRADAAVDPDQEDWSRDLRRILHLRGGSVFRGRSQLTEGVWRIRADRDWVELPAAAVERVADERRVTAQAKRLETEVGRDQGLRRVALADWMAREGLVEEALAQLDRVLEADPDQADALSLLASPARTLQVFGATQDAEVLVRTPPPTPALRELALARLAELEAPAVLHARLRSALAAGTPRSRAFAARGLGRLFPGEELEPLVRRAVLDGSADVRAESARALGHAGDPTLVLPVLKAFESKYSGVRENAAEALGWMAYPVAVEPLIGRLAAISSPAASNAPYRSPGAVLFAGRQTAFVQDFDVEIASGAAIADPQVNVLQEGSVLDVRVHGIHAATGFSGESRRIRASLERLTGADPGASAKSWQAWWEEHRDQGFEAAPTR